MVGGDPCDGDVFDGGPGNDDANFFRFTPGVNAQIGGPVSRDGGSCTPGRIDRSVEEIEGSPGPDVLIGSPSGDSLIGKGGDDSLFGRGGNDILSGGPGNDRLDGGPGHDSESPVAELPSARRSPPRRAAARTGRGRSPRGQSARPGGGRR